MSRPTPTPDAGDRRARPTRRAAVPSATDEPTPRARAIVEPVGRSSRRHARSPGIALVAVVFVAVFILLGGSVAGSRRAIAAPRRPVTDIDRALASADPTPGVAASVGPGPALRSGSLAAGLGRSVRRPGPRRGRRHRRLRARRRQRDGEPGRRHRRAPSSPPATTPTRTARADQFRDCYGADLGAFTGPDPAGAGQPRLGHQGPRRLPRLFRRRPRPRTARAGTRTTSGRGTSSCSTPTAGRSAAAGRTRRRVAGWPPTSRRRRPVHARDLAPPAVQLRRPRQRPDVGAVLDGALRRRRRRRRQRPRPRLRAVRPAGSGRRARTAARGIREFVVGTGGAALRSFPNAGGQQRAADAATHGVIRLVLHPGSYDWTFMPTDRRARPTPGTAPCH